jgi:hypothetical protein
MSKQQFDEFTARVGPAAKREVEGQGTRWGPLARLAVMDRNYSTLSIDQITYKSSKLLRSLPRGLANR